MARGNTKGKGKGSSGYNRKNSDDFLEKNRNKPGVQHTESGLQYMVIDQQDGDKPTEEDRVLVHQRITLIDGSVIDDTYKKNEPVEFSMAEAIPGYREGLRMMSLGSRYRFFIPSDLAWGKRGAGDKIGPNAVLIIDARLIEILDEF
jgi:FKBP-type peptidyl-prolyl cis-trans isomerase